MSLVALMAWSGLAWWWGCHTQQPGLELGDLSCKLELPWGSAIEVDNVALSLDCLLPFMGSCGNQLRLQESGRCQGVVTATSQTLGHFWPLCIAFSFSRADSHLWG